jgi:rSAM/selenodomain-associated transferase 2
MKLSIVIPTLDEARLICKALERLQPLRARGSEAIVADGGSRDGTFDLAVPLADAVLSASRGRALQMNAGAQRAHHEILVFLHADTQLPEAADALIADALEGNRRGWGRFDVRIDSAHPLLAIVASAMNLRSRLTSICTGDQCMFVRRDLFERVGGFPAIALMEDIALSHALRRHSRPVRIAERAITSARRWESRGVWRTMALMWWLRLRYFLGAQPGELQRVYEGDGR